MKRARDEHLAPGNRRSVAALAPHHFGWRVTGHVGVVTLKAFAWGFHSRLVEPAALQGTALEWASELAAGPSFAHAMTKRKLHQERPMGADEAIESEAQAQAICMMTQDFHRAYAAFVAKSEPLFAGD